VKLLPRIFISYRREDASAYAGRLYDRLSAHYGRERIFMDVDSIEPGADFGEAIEQTVASCDVFIAVIGKHWLDSQDAEGARRLDSPDDFVRLEISTALGRKIRVIPLLVANARMPRSDELPDPMKLLARRNAFEVSDVGFHENVSRLLEVLDHSDRAASPPAQKGRPVSASAAPPAPVRPAAPGIAQPSVARVPPPPALPPSPRSESDKPGQAAKGLSLRKALLWHLVFGVGLFHVAPQAKRKFIYPIAAIYALLDLVLALNNVVPFRDSGFGGATFVASSFIVSLGFVDIVLSWRARKKNPR
jgi:hypothetical protein